VGTNAIVAPARRYGSKARRSEGTVRKIFGAVAIFFGLVGASVAKPQYVEQGGKIQAS
jgi:hypothetical protein